jgi:hypothetical protein
MKFLFKNGSAGEIRFDAKGQPLFALSDLPGLPGIAEYTATAWLDAAATRSDFSVAGGYVDDPVVVYRSAEVARVAHWIRERVQPSVGSFATSFIPADPRVPF